MTQLLYRVHDTATVPCALVTQLLYRVHDTLGWRAVCMIQLA